MMKKIISILLCVCLLTGITSIASAAKKANVDKYEILDIFKRLNMLGEDYSGLTIDLEKNISRADFAFLSANVLKRDIVASDRLYFYDVSEQHWAYPYVTKLVDCGLLFVGEDKKFNPNDTITRDDAVKIILRALGYTFENVDYIDLTSIVNSIGITSGVSNVGDITYGDALQMLYNALTAEVIGISGVSNGSGMYTGTGKIYLEYEYSISFKRGIVEGFDGISFTGQSVDEGEALISGEKFEASDFDLRDLLGTTISYLYSFEDDDEKKLIWIKKDKTDELMIYYSDGPVKFDPSTYELTYYESSSERRKKINISKTADVIYNDEYVVSGIEELIAGDIYSMKLIKNSGDKEYSKVILSSYQNMIIGALDQINQCIYDKVTKQYISLNDIERFDIIKDNKKINFSDLSIDNILSVYTSQSGERIRIVVSDNVVKGNITSIDEEDGYTYIAIAESEYRSYKKTSYENISRNIPVTLYIDANGFIAYAEKYIAQGNLAYMFDISMADHDECMVVEMFKSNGKIEKVKTAETVRIDDKKFEYAEDAFDKLGGKTFNPSLILYKTNVDGLITHIYFPSKDKNAPLRQIYNQTLDNEGNVISESKKFQNQGYSRISSTLARFGNRTLINQNTIMFGIPFDPKHAYYEDFLMLSVQNIKIDKSYTYSKFALSNEVGYEEIIVLEDYTSLNTYEMLVTDVGIHLDQYDEAVEYVAGYVGNSYTSVNCKPEISLERMGIQEGHYIQYTLDGVGYINSIEQKSRNEILSSTSLRASGWSAGYANDIVGDVIKVGYKSGKNVEGVYYYDSSIPVYIYDTEIDEVRIGSISDIKTYNMVGNNCSIVFTSIMNGVPRVYVVYE